MESGCGIVSRPWLGGLQAPLRTGMNLVFTVRREIWKVTPGNPCAPLLAFFCDIISHGPIVLGSLFKEVLDTVIDLLRVPPLNHNSHSGVGLGAT